MSQSMSEPTKSYKVNDRRRFDEEGNEREGERQTVTPVTNQTPVSQPVAAQVSTEKPEAAEEPRAEEQAGDADSLDGSGHDESDTQYSAPVLSFSSFLMSLATQALIQMGEIEPPGGVKLPPDFEAAKQSIEIIGMMALKTKGNLDPEEQRLLREVLHSVRLAFVQRVKTSMGR